MNSIEEDLDNILDNEILSESSREYAKSMILSNYFIDAYELYEDMPEYMFFKLLKNKYIEYVGTKSSLIYIFNTASGQYLVVDEFANAKFVVYQLSNELYMKVIEFIDEQTRIYITNSKGVIIFYLEYDEQNKILKINNEDVIPSPLIKELSDEETEDIIMAANTYYMLHVISNN